MKFNKGLFSSSVLLLFLLAVASSNAVEANPYSFFWTHIDPVPGTAPPSITPINPANNSEVNSNLVFITFNVSKPIPPRSFDVGIYDIRYTVDADEDPNETRTVTVYPSSNVVRDGSNYIYYGNLTLPDGNHRIAVRATGVGHPASMTVFFIEGKAKILFTVDTCALRVSDVSVQNTTYNTRDIPLSFIVNETAMWYAYSLDGKSKVNITGNTTLSRLSDGNHSLVVYASDSVGNIGASETVSFTVDTSAVQVDVLQPKNVTYSLPSVPLVFTATKPSAFEYSLDGQANSTATGNMTLTGLSDGVHNVVVYARNEAGNVGVSTAAWFTVQTQPPLTQPPKASVKFEPGYVAIIVAVAAASSALMFFIVGKRATE